MKKMNKRDFYSFMFRLCGRAGCHQKAGRSFFYKGYQFPLCARCTGVFIGYIIAPIIYGFWKLSFSFYLGFCAIMFLDWYVQRVNIRKSTNIRRLLTGIIGGYGLMSVQIMVLHYIFHILFFEV